MQEQNKNIDQLFFLKIRKAWALEDGSQAIPPEDLAAAAQSVTGGWDT
jgi:hypothetical protein